MERYSSPDSGIGFEHVHVTGSGKLFGTALKSDNGVLKNDP